jgi:hypothetical protein
MDLDELPFPDRNKRAHRRLGERFATLVSSRGCWHASCLYCCIGAFHREKPRKFAQRSAASVAEEIAHLHHRKGVNLLQFHDDNFVLASPELTCTRVKDIHRELLARDVRVAELAFLIKARPDVVDNAVAEALGELGCVGVFLGVENATESGLHALCRGADLAGIERSLTCLTRQGIAVTYNLLVFHPHATMDEIRANVAFARKHPTLPFDFGRAEIVAGSSLERQVVSEGMRCGSWPMWDYRLRDPVVQRAFDVNRSTFRAPHSRYSALMHALIALCYHAAAPSGKAVAVPVLGQQHPGRHEVLLHALRAQGPSNTPPGPLAANQRDGILVDWNRQPAYYLRHEADRGQVLLPVRLAPVHECAVVHLRPRKERAAIGKS